MSLSADQKKDCAEAFALFDRSGAGSLPKAEISTVLRALGHNMQGPELDVRRPPPAARPPTAIFCCSGLSVCGSGRARCRILAAAVGETNGLVEAGEARGGESLAEQRCLLPAAELHPMEGSSGGGGGGLPAARCRAGEEALSMSRLLAGAQSGLYWERGFSGALEGGVGWGGAGEQGI